MGSAHRQNIYGRRGGRGLRPYLLMAKIVFVATFLGGLISLLVLVLLPAMPQSDEGRRAYADALHRAFAMVIIPSLVGAMISGISLLASVWRPLIRMRWLQVKAAIIFACVPLLHTFMRHWSQTLQTLVAAEHPDAATLATCRNHIIAGTVAILVFGVLTAILGRVKPRLGQRYGKKPRAGSR